MNKIEKIPEFIQAFPLIEQIEQAGYEAYFVGGGVRDTLLGLPISDVDIATSATPDEVQRIFPVTFDVGIQHGTVMVLHDKKTYEITTFRTESTYEDFRRPNKVAYVRNLDEDLKRRDFTMNAIAMDRYGSIHDPFGGEADLALRRIRAVGNPNERFREDALRMMRAARFMSQLGFNIEKETQEAVAENHPLLSKIAVERVRDEWTKLLIGRNRKGGVRFFVDTRLFYICPGFQRAKNQLLDIALFPMQFQTPLAAWTMVVYFLDIPTEKQERFLREWKLSKQEMVAIKKAVHALKLRLETFWDYPLLFDTGIKIALEVEELLKGFGVKQEFERLVALDQSLPIHHLQDLQINGQEVMAIFGQQRGGPYVGNILADIKKRVLAGTLVNTKEALHAFVVKRRFLYLDEVYSKSYTFQSEQSSSIPLYQVVEKVEETCVELMKTMLEEGTISRAIGLTIQKRMDIDQTSEIAVEVRVQQMNERTISFSYVVRKGQDIAAIGEHQRDFVIIKD